MNIQLSDHFTYRRLLRFTLPSIAMMIFTSIYSVVDGLFVANLVGSNALSSINIVAPLLIAVGAVGFMLGTGGSATVAKTMGEGNFLRAKRYFTMIIITIIILGGILSAVGIFFVRDISYFLGANDVLIENCVTYGTILLAGSIAFMLQTTFQTFFVTAQKPQLGFVLTVAAGLTNALLDFVFVYLLRMGVAGAAIATVCGYAVGGVVPLIYFLLPNKSLLRMVRTSFYPKVLLLSCANGSSEMMSNISMALVTFLYNVRVMQFAGEDGVAAITVISYVTFIFIAVLIGFSIGTAPIIGYHYGAQNHSELRNMFKKCMSFMAVVSALMALLAFLSAPLVAAVFVGGEGALHDMTLRGFRMYSLSFLFSGVNIFGSSFFTSLCNGKVSAAISFLRSLVFQAGMIMLLPIFLGLDGIWLAGAGAELLSVLVTAAFLIGYRKKYQYA